MQKLTAMLIFIFGLTLNAQSPTVEAPASQSALTLEQISPSASQSISAQPQAEQAVAVESPTPVESPKDICKSHFSTDTQSSGASACVFGISGTQKDGAAKTSQACHDKFSLSNRDELSCKIGVGIAEDLSRSQQLDKNKLKTCQELYPIVTALDAYFQEACLAGAYSVARNAKVNIKVCQGLSTDRSFIGPCVSGMSAAISSDTSKGSVIEQNKACLQYFDKTQFHTGYRACLNSHALFVISESNKSSVIKQCDLLTSNNKSETERAACIVGASIAKSTFENKSLPSRFQICGSGKASYQDREYLSCLTAASLLDFMDKSKARGACKSVFSSRKNKSRGQCASYIDKF